MTVQVRERDHRQFLAGFPRDLEQNVLRGGMRVLASVIADGAREMCRDPEVAATIGVSSRTEPGLVTSKVRLRGKGAFKGVFLEWGTAMHIISVKDEVRDGKTVRRLNMELKRGSLVIGGKFVGASVIHPGARPYPFLRPALDRDLGKGLAAMSGYIQQRLDKHGLAAGDWTFEADGE